MLAVDLEFDAETHSLEVLYAAAYRLMGSGSCQIEKVGSKYLCHIVASNAEDDPVRLRRLFCDLVTDESLRERLSEKTEAVRNLILSLAFGSLAVQEREQ